MPGEKVHNGPGEEVVAITGDHVPGAADIDKFDLREACKELVGSLVVLRDPDGFALTSRKLAASRFLGR